jgi:hypothetical protein
VPAFCGKKSDLTVDHKKRLKDGGAKYDRKNLRVLCRACNGKMARLGTKLRKDAEPWWLAKHAPGKHDQQSHAGGRGSSGDISEGAYIRRFKAGEDDKIFAELKEDQERFMKSSLNEAELKAVSNYQSEGVYDDYQPCFA